MAQVSYGSMTIADITDTSVYFEYALVQQDTTIDELLEENYFYNYFLTTNTTVEEGKPYFTRQGSSGNYTYTEVSNPTGNPQSKGYYERALKDENENSWSTIYPEWKYGYNVWTREVRATEEEIIYGDPYVDSAINQISNMVMNHEFDLAALQTRLTHLWTHNVESLTEESESYPYGTYAAAGIEGVKFKRESSNTYGYNSLLRHSSIDFRYNDAKLTSLGQNGIILYYLPIPQYTLTSDSAVIDDKVYYSRTISSGNTIFNQVTEPVTSGLSSYYELVFNHKNEKGLELTTEGLFLYNKTKYNATTDTSCLTNKEYFTKTTINNSDFYALVTNPTGNPNTQSWYEKEVTKAIELTEDGLKILDGSVLIGNSTENPSNNANGSIALTINDFSREIGNSTVEHLRFAIGDSFGVTSSGDVHIAGGVFLGSSFDNVFTKEETLNAFGVSELTDIQNTYLSNTAADQRFMNKEEAIANIQVIYKVSDTLPQKPDNQWIVATSGSGWVTVQPNYTANVTVYTAIQFQDITGNVTTTDPIIGTADLSNILTNGKINKNNLDLSAININDLTGQIDASHLNSSVIFNSIQESLQTDIQQALSSTTAQYVLKERMGGEEGLTKWENLNKTIEINPNAAIPYIRIAADQADKSSYLNLTGSQINFVIQSQSTPLTITPDGIITYDVWSQVLHMRAKEADYAFMWIVRNDGHLSLKLESLGS